VHLLGSICSLR